MPNPTIAALLLVTLLAACGGGGGGSSGGGSSADPTPTAAVNDGAPSASEPAPTAGLPPPPPPPAFSPSEAAADPTATPFAGQWQGSFGGNDSGSWQATVRADGTVTADGVFAMGGAFEAAGTISDTGELTLVTTVGVTTGATWQGTMTDGEVTGSWTHPGGEGGTFRGGQTSQVQAVAAAPSSLPDHLSLDHLSFDIWLERHGLDRLAGPAATTVATARQLLRTPTPLDAVPTTGTATYTGTMAAIETGATIDPATLHGPLTATADFTNATLAAEAHLHHTTNPTPWGSLTLEAAPITEGSFTARTTSTHGHTGTTTGHFSGPTAEALTGITSLEGPTTIHGTFAAERR